jgi:hypothetical protein
MNLLTSLHSIFQHEESLRRDEEVEAMGLEEEVEAKGLEEEDLDEDGGHDSEEEEDEDEEGCGRGRRGTRTVRGCKARGWR